MPTASTPYCRQVFRTPTFLKSLADHKIKTKEADDIVHFVAVNAQSGIIEHRQLGFMLKRLPWEGQLWVQYLEDSSRNIYLLAMTDEDIGPRPPKKNELLTRIFVRLWVAAAVRGVEWLGGLLHELWCVPHRSAAHRINANNQLLEDSSEDRFSVRADVGEFVGVDKVGNFYLEGTHAHLNILDGSRKIHQSDSFWGGGLNDASIQRVGSQALPIYRKNQSHSFPAKEALADDARLELKTMWLQLASRNGDGSCWE